MNIIHRPWLQLNPNDFSTQWWRSSHIIDANNAKIVKSDNEVICYFIIQDSNMCGEYWRVSTWYNNDPNRYSTVLGQTNWNFSSSLIAMKENDIVYLNHNPNIKFKVNLCRFSEDNQKDYCKILERVYN
jgi:hypothetical protein